jgi:hypothetical protein
VARAEQRGGEEEHGAKEQRRRGRGDRHVQFVVRASQRVWM